MASVREVIEASAAEGYASGVVALVAHGDAAVIDAAGTMAFGEARPMRPDTIFRIASMTKPITAAATLMLIEDGKLALDEPVDRLLPELAHRQVLRRLDGPLDDTVPADRPITVEDLLTFRMGLGVVFGSPDAFPILRAIAERDLAGFGPPDPRHPYGPDEWLRRLGQLPLMAQPGAQWLYTAPSNVLGVLIARASGQTFPDFVRRRIFEPLGMIDTGFFAPPDKLPRLPAAYVPTPGGPRLQDAPPDSGYAQSPPFPQGDSGLVSTARDVLAVSRLLLGGGLARGRRLLSAASVAAMTRDHLTAAQREGGAAILGPDHGWGYGLAVALRRTAEGVPAGAFGWNGGRGTSWIMDPASDTTVIVMTQTSFTNPDPPAVHKAVWRAAFGDVAGSA